MWKSVGATAFFLNVSLAFAQPIDVVVDRSADDVEIYFRLPASEMEQIFGLVPDTVLDLDGMVDFGALQMDSVTPGTEIFQKTRAQSSAGDVAFETISFMVHPTDTALPFMTPWDAMVTTTFCSVDPSAPPQGLGLMTTYVGYFADQVPHSGAITLDFPWVGRDAQVVRVTEFRDKELWRSYDATISENGELSLYDAEMTKSKRPFLFSWLRTQ
ncbi:MAG: hypothetical protein AAGJ34_05485 [Pseudomonadota bacterium]